MENKHSGSVSFESVIKEMINNRMAALGFHTAALFTLAGTAVRIVLQGYYVYVGWGMFIIGVILSIPYFIILMVSAHGGGVKVPKPNSSNKTVSADSYLDEAEIYIMFGQRKAAIKALKQGVEEFPENTELKDKLYEMENKH